MKYIQYDPKSYSDPAEIVRQCIESGAESVLIDETNIPEDFFDLSSGLLGELLHKLSIYHLKLAVVVSDPEKYSKYFQSFLYEANKGDAVRSFSSRRAAVSWLEEI